MEVATKRREVQNTSSSSTVVLSSFGKSEFLLLRSVVNTLVPYFDLRNMGGVVTTKVINIIRYL